MKKLNHREVKQLSCDHVSSIIIFISEGVSVYIERSFPRGHRTEELRKWTKIIKAYGLFNQHKTKSEKNQRKEMM